MKLIRKLHRWISVLVSIQLFIWIATGLYFNLVSNNWHSTKTFKVDSQNSPCPTTPVSIKQLPLPSGTISVQLNANYLQCFYLVHVDKVFHQYQLMNAHAFDPITAQPLTALSANEAETLAINSYSGPGNVVSTRLIAGQDSSNGKQQNPVWRVDFDDDISTSVYIHHITRQVIRHENTPSRIHKFMYTLHFMDYFNSGSFSNWLLRIFAMLTLMLTLTGLYWLFHQIKHKQIF